jgi:carbamoyl-phosphate synthase small subunit
MKLLLEDGTEIEGESFGAAKAVAGEVVFNTGMTGYVETLTDPSYRGQILVCTYPLVGNYGVPGPRAAGTLEGPYESDRIQVQGLVVQHYHAAYSHATAARSLGEWLQSEEIPAISGADTRALTRKIRENGTMKGWLLPNGATGDQARNSADEVVMSQVFDLVAPGETKTYPAGSLTVLLVDVGAKDNIVRAMLARDVTVVRASWRADLAQLARQADGVLIGNGPGDPKDLGPLINQLSALMVDYDKPIFGVCLGHQILALAAGGDTYKLKYGHRGVNQPVQDLLTRRCYVTSQNHGYAVRDESLPEAWEPWFINLNDGTNEGLRARLKPFYSVQFHPEAAPGPEDTGALFDDFVRLMGAMRRA